MLEKFFNKINEFRKSEKRTVLRFNISDSITFGKRNKAGTDKKYEENCSRDTSEYKTKFEQNADSGINATKKEKSGTNASENGCKCVRTSDNMVNGEIKCSHTCEILLCDVVGAAIVAKCVIKVANKIKKTL